MSNILAKLDPVQRAVFEQVPRPDFSDLAQARANLIAFVTAANEATPPPSGVDISDRHVPGLKGAPDVLVRIYQPTAAHRNGRGRGAPLFYWIHGGGLISGTVAMDEPFCANLVAATGCMVISVEYRLAPENPFPAPLDDCYAGLKWAWLNAASLGINRDRVIVGGASAGGGLAASLAIRARDEGEINVAFQFLNYPMIDDRNNTGSSREVVDSPTWSRSANELGWRAYLGRNASQDVLSSHAAAARETDLSGLPPAYIAVAQFDVFRDENIAYAQRLLAAGIAVELHVYPGAVHGSELLAPHAPVCQRWISQRDSFLRDLLNT